MKQFKTRLLAASVAALVSTGAAAQSYSLQVIESPESVRNVYGVALNDQGIAALQARIPRNAELDFEFISLALLQELGIPADFDPETDTLSYAQYVALVQRLEDRVNESPSSLRIAVNFAADYDGQTLSLPAFLNSEGNGASSQLNSADHQFLGLNQNNIRVGIATAPYERFEYTYQPEPAEGQDTPDPVTTSYVKRDFTSRAMWYDGTTYKLLEPSEQTILGGESGLFDINENNVAAGFTSVSITPRAQTRIDTCLEFDSDPSSAIPSYTCVWSAWHAFQRGTATNLSSFRGTELRTNGSIYNMHATLWQLDAQGEVISQTQYAPLVEQLADDENEWSTYAYAVNNNGVAVGQSWTYFGDEPQVGGRIKMPAIFINGETRPVITDETYVWGTATDINDDDIAVGFVLRNFEGTRRAYPFKYDVNSDAFELLPTFFTGSSTYPNAINNQGFVVGSAEIDSTANTTRRRVGFVYDMNNPDQGLIDLNDAVGCSADYFIVSADGINEQNQILVTATTDKDYTNSEGETQSEQVSLSLILNPESGEITNCTDEGSQIQRQGGAMSPLGLFAMLLIGGLITVRRKFMR
ncbi:DUF3466 family protein [Pseudidiomarina sp.]|uniref:DUF3466 family protein n=1 Tax=Pseudidiomarina sp. TaxID=2081707 RepID=UPI003A98217C